MGRVATILGSSAFGPAGGEIRAAAERHGAFALQRHDAGEGFRLPHLIDHAANLRSVAEAGCDRVLAVGSVGSLRPELGVGSFVSPNDFIALQLTVTTFDDERGHTTPGFDLGWRGEVLSAWAASGAGEIHDGGVYWQTNGPRFETAAEIRLIGDHADLVGMTLASECIVAGELGLSYAAVCVVDNLANGVGSRPLSPLDVEAHRAANADRLRDGLDLVLRRLPR